MPIQRTADRDPETFGDLVLTESKSYKIAVHTSQIFLGLGKGIEHVKHVLDGHLALYQAAAATAAAAAADTSTNKVTGRSDQAVTN